MEEQEVAYVRDIPDKITVEGTETITNLNDYKGFNADFFTVSSETPWCHIENRYTIRTEANPTGLPRTATVSISWRDAEMKRLTIEQKDLGYMIINDLMVQNTDICEGLDEYWGVGGGWETANNLCENAEQFGFKDWRLPTKAEMKMLYLNKQSMGVLAPTKKYYWCYSENRNDYFADCSSLGVFGPCINFQNGYVFENGAEISNSPESGNITAFSVRCVRAMSSTKSATAIMFAARMSDIAVKEVKEASDVCRCSREGGFSDWRLPSITELKLLKSGISANEQLTADAIYVSDAVITLRCGETSEMAVLFDANKEQPVWENRVSTRRISVRCVRTVK
jgi:hypothetical protein